LVSLLCSVFAVFNALCFYFVFYFVCL